MCCGLTQAHDYTERGVAKSQDVAMKRILKNNN